MELAAAAAADYGLLPLDVLHDILLRLPADEVCRLRLVCQTWWSLSSDPLFARAHAARHPQPNVVVVHRHDDDEAAAEVRVIDLQGNVIKRTKIGQPIVGPLSLHGDKLCASLGWGQTCVVDMVTGAVEDVGIDHRKKVNSPTPYCLLGKVLATGEYKLLRLQADCSRRRWRQTCEIMTLGGLGDAGKWRRRTRPPVTLRIEPGSSSWAAAVVGGLAYFLVCWGHESELNMHLEADGIAVFDLETEWKPTTIQGPLTSILLASTETQPYRRRPIVGWHCVDPLMKRFQLARVGDSLVLVYCNVEDQSTELWFLEDTDHDTSVPCWSKRYTLQSTLFAEDKPKVHDYFRITVSVQQYHYPLAVLDDGRILVCVDRTSALRAYDPETSAWTDLATLTGDYVVGMHHGSLPYSNVGGLHAQDSFRRLPSHLIPTTSYIGVVLILVFSFIWRYYVSMLVGK